MVESDATGIDICPVCREPRRPTSFSDGHPDGQGARVPVTWSCPHDCEQTVCAEEWERAVLRLAQERREASRR